MRAAETLERLSPAPHGVWTALDPERKRLLAVNVGARPLAMAPCGVPQVAQMLAPDCVPLLLSAGFRASLTALVPHCGHWVQPPRRPARGAAPKPHWRPLPTLLDAQVVKTVRRRRLGAMHHRLIGGTKAAVAQVLPACGWQSNTAFGERLNLRLRQRVAAIGRRSATLCKSEEGLRQHLTLFQVYHHCVLPHTSVRQALAESVPTTGSGSAQWWRPWTPAMAAGLTEHVWALREVWLYRVPPGPPPEMA